MHVCGSFGVKANAENLKNFLDKEGYNAVIAFNADAAMYRVIVSIPLQFLPIGKTAVWLSVVKE